MIEDAWASSFVSPHSFGIRGRTAGRVPLCRFAQAVAAGRLPCMVEFVKPCRTQRTYIDIALELERTQYAVGNLKALVCNLEYVVFAISINDKSVVNEVSYRLLPSSLRSSVAHLHKIPTICHYS